MKPRKFKTERELSVLRLFPEKKRTNKTSKTYIRVPTTLINLKRQSKTSFVLIKIPIIKIKPMADKYKTNKKCGMNH